MDKPDGCEGKDSPGPNHDALRDRRSCCTFKSLRLTLDLYTTNVSHSRVTGIPTHVQWDDHHAVNSVPNLPTTPLTHARTPGYWEQWAISSATLIMQLRPRNHLLARKTAWFRSKCAPGKQSALAGNDPRGMMNHAAHSSRRSRDGACEKGHRVGAFSSQRDSIHMDNRNSSFF